MKPSARYTMCRTLGHAWQVDTFAHPKKQRTLDLHCIRCGTSRQDLIGSDGSLLGRGYVYPKDYAKVDKQPRASWRLSLLSWSLNDLRKTANDVKAEL